jgi:hypothetical protein
MNFQYSPWQRPRAAPNAVPARSWPATNAVAADVPARMGRKPRKKRGSKMRATQDPLNPVNVTLRAALKAKKKTLRAALKALKKKGKLCKHKSLETVEAEKDYDLANKAWNAANDAVRGNLYVWRYIWNKARAALKALNKAHAFLKHKRLETVEAEKDYVLAHKDWNAANDAMELFVRDHCYHMVSESGRFFSQLSPILPKGASFQKTS